MLTVGSMVVDFMLIPPRQTSWETTGVCTKECTQEVAVFFFFFTFLNFKASNSVSDRTRSKQDQTTAKLVTDLFIIARLIDSVLILINALRPIFIFLFFHLI